MPRLVQGLIAIAIALYLVSLPLGTTPQEIATGLLLLAALGVAVALRRWEGGPLDGPAIVVVAGAALTALAPSGELGPVLSRAWALAPAVVLPFLLRQAVALPRMEIALAAALPVAGLAVGQAGVAALLGAPIHAAGLLALVAAPIGLSDLSQRAVLWTAGAQVALDGGAPLGTWSSVIGPVHHALLPTFDFPFHAHDTFLQSAADGGFATWIALGWVAVLVWTRGPAWLCGTVAALAFGGLSQDWLGDLEVIRALATFAVLGLMGALSAPLGGPQADPVPEPDAADAVGDVA